MTTIPRDQCSHFSGASVPTWTSDVCKECSVPSPLLMCLTCGYVGCSDAADGHATVHASTSDHPQAISLPMTAQSQTWCHKCEAYLS